MRDGGQGKWALMVCVGCGFGGSVVCECCGRVSSNVGGVGRHMRMVA